MKHITETFKRTFKIIKVFKVNVINQIQKKL